MEKLKKRIKLLGEAKKGSSFLEKLKRVKRFKLLGEAKKGSSFLEKLKKGQAFWRS